MKTKSILSGEAVKQLNQAMEQIRLSLEGLASMTGNMIPEQLLSADFEAYLSSWCKEIGSINSIKVQPTFTGEFQWMKDMQKIRTFLVTQSLLDFLIYQTKPKHIFLIFVFSENSVTIEVKDDGRKYDLPIFMYPGVKASEEFKTKAESMNGVFTIQRTKKKGNQAKVIIAN